MGSTRLHLVLCVGAVLLGPTYSLHPTALAQTAEITRDENDNYIASGLFFLTF